MVYSPRFLRSSRSYSWGGRPGFPVGFRQFYLNSISGVSTRPNAGNVRSWHGWGRLLSQRLERIFDTLITLVETQIETPVAMKPRCWSKVLISALAESRFAARMAARVPEALIAEEGIGFFQFLLYLCRFLSLCYRLVLFSFVLENLACIYRRLREGSSHVCYRDFSFPAATSLGRSFTNDIFAAQLQGPPLFHLQRHLKYWAPPFGTMYPIRSGTSPTRPLSWASCLLRNQRANS